MLVPAVPSDVPLLCGVDTTTANQERFELVVDQHRHILERSDLAGEDRVAGSVRNQAVKADVELVESLEVCG